MSVLTEINRIKAAVTAIATAIRNKGVTVPTTAKVDDLATYISSINKDAVLQNKTVTPKTTQQTVIPDKDFDGLSRVTVNAIPNQRTASDVTVSGATVTTPAGYYASKVEKSVATATRASTTLTSAKNNDTLVFTAGNNQSTGYVTGSNSTATKTVSLSASGATVTASDGTNSISKSVATATRASTSITTTADDTNDRLTLTASNNQGTGYVTGSNQTASKVITLMVSGSTVTAMDNSATSVKISKSVATATQATPSITVSTAGLITASATQAAGYVSGGTKSATKQLTTQAAKTVTPTTNNQTAVASGRYTTGAVTVEGDANLVAGNIKNGVSIFGVTGTYEGESGGGANIATCTVNIIWSITPRRPIITATTFENGAISIFTSKTESGTVTIPNVVCGSVVTVYTGTMTSVYGWSYGKANSNDAYTHALTIPASTGTYTAEIGVIDD